MINSLRPRPNRRHFADDIFKWIFFNENIWILIKISLKFVPKGPINNIPALVQIMAWHRPGDKPLSEPMVLSSLTHICVTRPQWVKSMSMKLKTCNVKMCLWCPGHSLDVGLNEVGEVGGVDGLDVAAVHVHQVVVCLHGFLKWGMITCRVITRYDKGVRWEMNSHSIINKTALFQIAAPYMVTTPQWVNINILWSVS